jgi:hypothetical protein
VAREEKGWIKGYEIQVTANQHGYLQIIAEKSRSAKGAK